MGSTIKELKDVLNYFRETDGSWSQTIFSDSSFQIRVFPYKKQGYEDFYIATLGSLDSHAEEHPHALARSPRKAQAFLLRIIADAYASV